MKKCIWVTEIKRSTNDPKWHIGIGWPIGKTKREWSENVMMSLDIPTIYTSDHGLNKDVIRAVRYIPANR